MNSEGVMRLVVVSRPAAVGSQTAWRMTASLPADLQNSHQDGGCVFLIFVADPRTIRLSNNRGGGQMGKLPSCSVSLASP